MEDENQRAVSKLEIMKFVEENDLLYIGESSALADVNIKEVVETLMESIDYIFLFIFFIEIHEVQLKVVEKKV